MTELPKLKVSLTKFGVHKIANLLLNFEPNEVINNLQGSFQDIVVDPAQAKKVLSIYPDGRVPELWWKVKEYEKQDIFDLVFLCIIFSHHRLIELITESFRNENKIFRNTRLINTKEYTNFSREAQDLGFVVDQSNDYIVIDINRIFYKFYLVELISELLELKLIEAGWDQANSLAEECIQLGINEVFNLAPETFQSWIEGSENVDELVSEISRVPREYNLGIKFTSGHNPKFSGTIVGKRLSKTQTSTLVHNRIQTKIYEILCSSFETDEIGTEVPSNAGSIDIVRRNEEGYFLYEIKTARDIRSSIRQALSQLLEYAYWGNISNVIQLIIIAPNPVTDEAINYLQLLRQKFNIPIFYQYYDESANYLHDLV